MRRMALMVVTMSLALLAAGGAAWAANQIECPNRPSGACVGTERADRIDGTDRRDEIHARGGADVVLAKAGNDLTYGGRGDDSINAGDCFNARVFAGGGDDTVSVSDSGCVTLDFVGAPPPDWDDKVDCGGGFDVVRGVSREFQRDEIAPDCERVMTE